MALFFRIFTHLLPRGRAWRITVEKALRQFFAGLANALPPIRVYIDDVWRDLFPLTTRDLAGWEDQWALPASGLNDGERRARLGAAWKALGGQSPRYIQDTLRGAGFNVYVHEWWVPGTEAATGVHSCATPRSPVVYLRREYTGRQSAVDCGEALAACGEAFAECGNGTEPRGYPLVNKILRTSPDYLALCGEEDIVCGEDGAACGEYASFRTDLREYVVPLDPAKWCYFLYIGAENIDDIAQVPPSRRDEFEALCLKIRPTHLWLGILVEYV